MVQCFFPIRHGVQRAIVALFAVLALHPGGGARLEAPDAPAPDVVVLERPKARIQGRDPFQMLRHLYEKGIVPERARALTGSWDYSVGGCSIFQQVGCPIVGCTRFGCTMLWLCQFRL